MIVGVSVELDEYYNLRPSTQLRYMHEKTHNKSPSYNFI